jgi:uncharacterized repeat protein (TIGR02543 family)
VNSIIGEITMQKFSKVFVIAIVLIGIFALSACNDTGALASEYNLYFKSDGRVVHTIKLGKYDVVLPSEPVKEGYAFQGWYWDNDAWQQPFDIDTFDYSDIQADLTLYARWTIIESEDESGQEGEEGQDAIAITNAEELASLTLNGEYYLANDIDLGGAKWIPIKPGGYFSGVFDGRNHTISNFEIDSFASYSGFFEGIGNEGEVKNLTLTDCEIEISSDKNVLVGGLAGINNGSIINCHIECNIILSATGQTSYTYAGGLTSYNYGIINGCSSAGDISVESEGIASAGGLAVVNTGTISACSSSANVSAVGKTVIQNGDDNADAFPEIISTAMAGGLVALSTVNITDCYATGAVYAESASSQAYAGGLIGSSLNATFTNCFALGNVSAKSAKEAYAGGFIAYLNIKAENCFALGDISAESAESFAYGSAFAGLTGEGYQIDNCYFGEGQTIHRKEVEEVTGEPCNSLGTPVSANCFTSPDWIRTNLGWGEYVSPQDLEENPGNVWVLADGEFPRLYFEV